MLPAVWTLIGLLVGTILGLGYYLGSRIDALGARLDGKIDALGARLDSRIDAQTGRIDAQTGRIDALTEAFGDHLRRHIV
jgi:hypothetical protein